MQCIVSGLFSLFRIYCWLAGTLKPLPCLTQRAWPFTWRTSLTMIEKAKVWGQQETNLTSESDFTSAAVTSLLEFVMKGLWIIGSRQNPPSSNQKIFQPTKSSICGQNDFDTCFRTCCLWCSSSWLAGKDCDQWWFTVYSCWTNELMQPSWSPNST